MFKINSQSEYHPPRKSKLLYSEWNTVMGAVSRESIRILLYQMAPRMKITKAPGRYPIWAIFPTVDFLRGLLFFIKN